VGEQVGIAWGNETIVDVEIAISGLWGFVTLICTRQISFTAVTRRVSPAYEERSLGMD
jgi:hypothetical protein